MTKQNIKLEELNFENSVEEIRNALAKELNISDPSRVGIMLGDIVTTAPQLLKQPIKLIPETENAGFFMVLIASDPALQGNTQVNEAKPSSSSSGTQVTNPPSNPAPPRVNPRNKGVIRYKTEFANLLPQAEGNRIETIKRKQGFLNIPSVGDGNTLRVVRTAIVDALNRDDVRLVNNEDDVSIKLGDTELNIPQNMNIPFSEIISSYPADEIQVSFKPIEGPLVSTYADLLLLLPEAKGQLLCLRYEKMFLNIPSVGDKNTLREVRKAIADALGVEEDLVMIKYRNSSGLPTFIHMDDDSLDRELINVVNLKAQSSVFVVLKSPNPSS